MFDFTLIISNNFSIWNSNFPVVYWFWEHNMLFPSPEAFNLSSYCIWGCVYTPNHLCEFGFRIMRQSKLLLTCCLFIQNLRWHALDVRFVRVIWGFIWWRYENNFCSFLVKNSTDCIVICNMMILYGSWRNFFLRTSMSIFSLIHALVSL